MSEPGEDLASVKFEYAIMMSGGGYHICADDRELEKIMPLDRWIKSQWKSGRKVFRRAIHVIQDWQEMPAHE
jgi:hypothetical protein